MIANPTAQYESAPTEKSTRFFIMMFAAFFARVNPLSSMAKPGCMAITRNPHINTQIKSRGALGFSARVASPEGSAAQAGLTIIARKMRIISINNVD